MVALVSTVHDPSGRMVETAHRLFARVRGLYEAVAIVPTPATSPHLLNALDGAVVSPLEESAGAIGVGRRRALQLGLEAGANHIHYCDFDRLLHWIGRYPQELAGILQEIQRHEYLIIGRTSRAFGSHPRVQRDTEAITNHAFSLWFGAPVDVAAGSCGVSRPAAQLLLQRSTAPTNATDAEWPALVQVSWPGSVGYAETEGLEFETSDYFPEEVAAAGSVERWLEERSKPLDAWIARTRLTLQSLEALRAVAEAGWTEAGSSRSAALSIKPSSA